VDWHPEPAPDPWDATSEAGWRAFIQAHEVCFEAGPLNVPDAGRRRRAGFEIALYARHPRGLRADPTDRESANLRQGLADLADQAWQDSIATTGLVMRARFEHARLLLRREAGWVPELGVRLEIQPRHATFAEPDGPQRAGVRAFEQRLLALGVRRGAWRRI
jgi:hypothetical protein